MGEFLGIMLSIIFFVAPKDVERLEVWPYAADSKEHLKRLSLPFRKRGDAWCPDDADVKETQCITIKDGKWVADVGEVLLDIRSNLTITGGTNYTFKPKDWDNPLKFSVRGNGDERTFEIKDDGKTVREFKVKMWKSRKNDAPDDGAATSVENSDASEGGRPR